MYSPAESLYIVLVSFSAIFSFAFGLAWFIPMLKIEMPEFPSESQEAPKDSLSWWSFLIDQILILLDIIPIFWIYHLIMGLIQTAYTVPENVRVAQQTWKESPQIRNMFWAWIISCTCLIALICVEGIYTA